METKDVPISQEDDLLTVIGSVFGLFSRSWEAFKLNFGTLVLLLIMPALVATTLFIPLVLTGLFLGGRIGSDNSTGQVFGGVLIPLALIIALLMVIISVAGMVAQIASAKGNKIGFGESVRQAFALSVPLLALLILSGLMIVAGLVLFIIPGLLAIFFLMFSPYFVIDQKLSATDAMRASFALVKTNWKASLGLLVVQLIIGLPNAVPVLGWIASFVLGVVYFCLPAIIYLKLTTTPQVKSAEMVSQ